MFCGGVIEVGEKYQRNTIVNDGEIYDFICHDECDEVACKLEMYAETCYDDGVTAEYFRDRVFEYCDETYHGEFNKLTYHEKVKKILEDWDKPEIAIPRIKGKIIELEWRAKESPFALQWLEQYRKQLESYQIKL